MKLEVMIDETQLADRIRRRDPAALRMVVKSYLSPILRAARVVCLDAGQAEEVTQATFATFIEKAERFEGRSHVRTWLFGILYHKVAENRRHLARERRFHDIEDIVERRFGPDGRWRRPPRPVDLQLYDSEVRQALSECLEGVSVRQRLAFVLREVEGLETGEICRIIEVTPTNLGSILCRVRIRLRECLEARGIRG